MSKQLSNIMGVNNQIFANKIASLELASGNQNCDIRLGLEITTKVREATRAMGLDPADTNGPELYNALINMARTHDKFLVRNIGGKDSGDVADLLPRITAVANKINMPKKVWVIKNSVAKRLLKSMPPKKLMKLLNYRSLDSMLKRQPMGVIFCSLRFAETPEWQAQFVQLYLKLHPSDFEEREAIIYNLTDEKWLKVGTSSRPGLDHHIIESRETGAIIILPLPADHLPGLTIVLLPLILHLINELRVYSSFFKLQQVSPDFGHIYADTIHNDNDYFLIAAGQKIHWRTIMKHFADQPISQHPEMFEPYVGHEDLAWRKAEDTIYKLEPALHFWFGMDYVGKNFKDQIVSFNLIDVATNYINQLTYSNQVTGHLSKSLQNELYARYLGHPSIEAKVLSQLDNNLMATTYKDVVGAIN